MMNGWAPFMSINNAGDFSGFDVDLAQEIAKQLNKKLVIKDLGSLASLFLALDQKKIDLLMSGLDITQARLSKVNMIPYTGDAVRNFTLLFWQKVPTEVTKIEDLQDAKLGEVCAEPGSAQEKFLDQFPAINKKSLAGTTDMVLALRFGKAIAALLEPQVAARLMTQEPNLVSLTIPLPEEFVVYGMGIATKNTDTSLTAKIQDAVQALKENGTIERLEQAWGLKGQS